QVLKWVQVFFDLFNLGLLATIAFGDIELDNFAAFLADFASVINGGVSLIVDLVRALGVDPPPILLRIQGTLNMLAGFLNIVKGLFSLGFGLGFLADPIKAGLKWLVGTGSKVLLAV